MKKSNIGKIIAGGVAVFFVTLTGLFLRGRYSKKESRKKREIEVANYEPSSSIEVLSFSLLVLNWKDIELEPMIAPIATKIGRIKNSWNDSPSSRSDFVYGSYFNVYILPEHGFVA